MATTSMNIRTDSEVKKQAEELFAEFGLNMTTAINMFLRQTIRDKAIPFEISLKEQPVQSLKVEEQEQRLAWLEKLHKAVDESMGEELPDHCFQRSNTMREPIDLKD